MPVAPARLQVGDPLCQHCRTENKIAPAQTPNEWTTCRNSSEAGYDCNLPAGAPQCLAHQSLRWLCLAQCMWLPGCRRPEGAAQPSCLIRGSASQPCSTPDASLLVLAALGAVHVDTGDRLQGSPQGLQLLQRLACVLQQATRSAEAHLYSQNLLLLASVILCTPGAWGSSMCVCPHAGCNSALHQPAQPCQEVWDETGIEPAHSTCCAGRQA